MHDWVLANQLMARTLAEKGYKSRSSSHRTPATAIAA